jgi:hypothetical protein
MQYLAKPLLTWVLSPPFWKSELRFCRKRRDTHHTHPSYIDTSQQQYHKSPGSVMCHPLSAFLVAVVPTILELSSAPGEK